MKSTICMLLTLIATSLCCAEDNVILKSIAPYIAPGGTLSIELSEDVIFKGINKNTAQETKVTWNNSIITCNAALDHAAGRIALIAKSITLKDNPLKTYTFIGYANDPRDKKPSIKAFFDAMPENKMFLRKGTKTELVLITSLPAIFYNSEYMDKNLELHLNTPAILNVDK